MTEVLAIVLPVFALVAIGFGAAKTGYVPKMVGDGLGTYAYALALPALLFRTLSTAELPATIPWGYWGAYFGAVALVWCIGQMTARRLFAAEPREAVIVGLAVAQANTVMVGIPLILQAYGPSGAVPIALLLGVNLPITMTLATLLFETRGIGGGAAAARALARGLATHPILIAILCGLLANMLSLRAPALIDQLLAALAATAIPCALVGLGMSLAAHGAAGQWRLVVFVSAVKLLVMPAIVFLLGGFVFDLQPLWLGAAVIFAAAPVGVNVYVFAARYLTGVAVASTSIAVKTLLAALTTVVWLRVLGIG
jgi:predicted permease